MEPITLRLPEDMAAALDEEADELGYSSRSEYVRHVLRNRSDTGPNTSAYSERNQTEHSDLADRVEELEAAVFDENAAQARDSSSGADDTPTPQAPESNAPNPDSADMDEFRSELGGWLAANGPRTEHGRRGVLRCVDELAARGPLTSEALTDMLDDEIGDQYSRRKSMWESIKRHLEQCPAIRQTDNYQEWAFVGVGETREKL